MLLTFAQHSQQIVDMYINWGRLITLPQTRKPLNACAKTNPKYLPNPFQISLKSVQGPSWEPLRKRVPFFRLLAPQNGTKQPILAPHGLLGAAKVKKSP